VLVAELVQVEEEEVHLGRNARDNYPHSCLDSASTTHPPRCNCSSHMTGSNTGLRRWR
jgi:hypothetical protein